MNEESIEYMNQALANASCDEPKNIFGLMRGLGAWNSQPACDAVEYLESRGFLAEHHRDGPYFQHRYFVKGAK